MMKHCANNYMKKIIKYYNLLNVKKIGRFTIEFISSICAFA